MWSGLELPWLFLGLD